MSPGLSLCTWLGYVLCYGFQPINSTDLLAGGQCYFYLSVRRSSFAILLVEIFLQDMYDLAIARTMIGLSRSLHALPKLFGEAYFVAHDIRIF